MLLLSPPLVNTPSSTTSSPSFITANELDVGQLIGKGGFASAVYRARCRRSGGGKEQHIALKIVDIRQKKKNNKSVARRRSDEEEEESGGGGLGTQASNRISAEVKVHNGLLHPSIVEMLAWFRDDRFVYVALELCEGGDMHAALRSQGPFSEAYIASITGQIVSGLLYLHDTCGIVHRDLKLSNILLSGDGRRAKISDFGLAADIRDGMMRRTLCGTPNYMAPEIALRQPYGSSVDLWSIGCLIFAMFIGRAPFQGKTARDTLENVVRGVYDNLSIEEISPEAENAVVGLLDPDPMSRMRLKDLQEHPFLYLPLHHEIPVHSKKDPLATPIQGFHSTPNSVGTTVVSPVSTLDHVIDDSLSTTTDQRMVSCAPRCLDTTEDLTPSTIELPHLKHQHILTEGNMSTTVEKQEKDGGHEKQQQSRGKTASDTLYLKGEPFPSEDDAICSTSTACSSSEEYFGPRMVGGGYENSIRLPANNGVRRRRRKFQQHIPRHNHSGYSRGRRHIRSRRVGVGGRRKVSAAPIKRKELDNVRQETAQPFSSIVRVEKEEDHHCPNDQMALLQRSSRHDHPKPLMTTTTIPVTVGEDSTCRSRIRGGSLEDKANHLPVNEKDLEEDSACALNRVNLSRLSSCTFSSENASFSISPGGSAVVFMKNTGIWLSLSSEGEIHVGEVEQKPFPFGITSAAVEEVSAHSIFTVPDTVKCYLLMELPVVYHAAYRLLEKAVETLRSKTAKVTLRITTGKETDEVAVNATLMDNPPLPDFRVVWADHASLMYSLNTGEMELKEEGGTTALKTIDGESEVETMKGGATVPSWLTFGEKNSMVSVKWVAEEGWTGGPPSTPSAMRLSFAQKALLRCLHEERVADRFPLELTIPMDEIANFSSGALTQTNAIEGAPSNPLQGWDDHLAAAMGALEPPEKMTPIVPVQPLLSVNEVKNCQYKSSSEAQESGYLAFISSDAESIVMMNDSHDEEDKNVVKKSHHGIRDSSLQQPHPSQLPPVAVSRKGMSNGSHPSSTVNPNTLPLCGDPSQTKGEGIDVPDEHVPTPSHLVVPDSIKTTKCPENKSMGHHYTKRRRRRREGRILGVGVASKNSSGDLHIKFEDGAEITVSHNASWVRYRHADTSGEGSAASVDIFDLTSRNKLSPALRRRMKLVPEFITALKEAYRRKTTVSL